MKLGKIIILTVLTVFSLNTLANDKAVGTGPNPFSDCGIGAALFPKTPLAAVLSNTFWDAGTTALTSATASPETCNAKAVAAAAFINETYENLLDETAAGHGQHLSAMLEVFGCSSSEKSNAVNEIRSELRDQVNSDEFSSNTRLE
ncbi:MAG: DUF3015 family protein, partial [Porticoccaceae bacterium]